MRAGTEVSTEAVSSLVSLAAGDSSQDEAEEDVKQITVSSSPRGRVWAEGRATLQRSGLEGKAQEGLCRGCRR